MKAHFALVGIICVLMVATTSLQVAYAKTNLVPFPACPNLPHAYLKGAWIFQVTSVPRKGFSFVRMFFASKWVPWPTQQGGSLWSSLPEAYKKEFLSSGTRVDLYVNGKKQFLLMDICYDATGMYSYGPETVYKFFFMQYFPYEWRAGSYSFHFIYLYNGAPYMDLPPVTVTFT